jgi:hypothetical protein
MNIVCAPTFLTIYDGCANEPYGLDWDGAELDRKPGAVTKHSSELPLPDIGKDNFICHPSKHFDGSLTSEARL